MPTSGRLRTLPVVLRVVGLLVLGVAAVQAESTDPDLALDLEYFDDALAQSRYTAEDLRAVRASRARLALVLTVRDGYHRTRSERGEGHLCWGVAGITPSRW